MSTLKEKAEAILQEKEEKIIPDNLKPDVTIFGVTGSTPSVTTNLTCKIIPGDSWWEEMQYQQFPNWFDINDIKNLDFNVSDLAMWNMPIKQVYPNYTNNNRTFQQEILNVTPYMYLFIQDIQYNEYESKIHFGDVELICSSDPIKFMTNEDYRNVEFYFTSAMKINFMGGFMTNEDAETYEPIEYESIFEFWNDQCNNLFYSNIYSGSNWGLSRTSQSGYFNIEPGRSFLFTNI